MASMTCDVTTHTHQLPDYREQITTLRWDDAHSIYDGPVHMMIYYFDAMSDMHNITLLVLVPTQHHIGHIVTHTCILQRTCYQCTADIDRELSTIPVLEDPCFDVRMDKLPSWLDSMPGTI